MRCLPRKSRHQWILFLLAVCLFGVYLTYRRLIDKDTSRKHLPTRPKETFDEIKQKLDKQVKQELSIGKKAADIGSKIGNIDLIPQVNDDNMDGLGDVAVGRVLDNEADYVSTEEKYARLKLLLIQLSPTDWRTAPDPDEMILLTKSELMDLNMDSKLSCREIDRLKPAPNRNQGFHGKKYVDYMKQDSKHDLVVKSVGTDHQFKMDCMKMDYNADRCHLMSNYKLVKELVLLLLLENPTLVKLEGWCLRGDTIDVRVSKRGVILVTEAGQQAQLEMLTMLAWRSRIEIAVKMIKLLQYLERSPIGTLGFDHLHLPDFVLVDGEIRLVDLDNIHVGEPICKVDEDCRIREVPNKAIKCVEGVCKGYNAAKNLFYLKTGLLNAMFRISPESMRGEIQAFLTKISNLQVTQAEALLWFQQQLTKADDAEDDRMVRVPDNDLPGNRDNQRRRVTEAPSPLKFEDQGAADGYDKIMNANFPGRFDYHCPGSRVTWGCVLTVYGLQEAKKLCDDDSSCEAFIVFSQHPETDAMMTMVKKSSFEPNHDLNYGAALYHKRRKQPAAEEPKILTNDDIANQNRDGKSANQGQGGNRNVGEATPSLTGDQETCVKRVRNITESARNRREKRLYTHLGLRDISERDWKIYAQTVRISRSLGLSSLMTSTVRGGRVKLEFAANALNLKKGEYMLEYGEKHHHVAYLCAYYLDRTLGLYHVPPAVARSLAKNEYTSIAGNGDHMDRLANVTSKEGTWLQGLVTVAMPPVMKTEKLTIPKLEQIVDKVTNFTRSQKVQLEYILLWSLTKMMQPKHGFLGYKGHLIHFEADLAFTSLHKSQTGYFYNCQFPNTVWKTLNCYRCADRKKICGLGEEVIKQVRYSGFMDNEITVGTLGYSDLINVIDSSATSILQVVETCVRTFTREKVIY